MTTETDKERGVYVTDIHNDDYIKVRCVDFGDKGASRFTACASSRYFGGQIELRLDHKEGEIIQIELRLDNKEGEIIGTLDISYTGEWKNWREFETSVKSVTGVHDLYLVFKGKKPHSLFNLDWWKFDN